MANILFHGAELEDFVATEGWTHSTSGGTFRSGYARAAMVCTSGGVAGSLRGAFTTTATTVGASARWGWIWDVSPAQQPCFGLTNGGQFAIGVATQAGALRFQLVVWNGATYTTLATSELYSGSIGFRRFDIYIEDWGETARVRVWLKLADEVANLIFDESNVDLTVTGFANADGVYVAPFHSAGGSYISEVFAADAPTTRMNLVTLAINGVGDGDTFDSGDYTDVDELNADLADFLESGSVGQTFLADVTGLPTTTQVPISVKVTALAAKGEAGPEYLDLSIKSGSASHGAPQALDVAFAPVYRTMSGTNPATAADWEIADIATLQIGCKTDSLA